jgi:hypothetical protein
VYSPLCCSPTRNPIRWRQHHRVDVSGAWARAFDWPTRPATSAIETLCAAGGAQQGAGSLLTPACDILGGKIAAALPACTRGAAEPPSECRLFGTERCEWYHCGNGLHPDQLAAPVLMLDHYCFTLNSGPATGASLHSHIRDCQLPQPSASASPCIV